LEGLLLPLSGLLPSDLVPSDLLAPDFPPSPLEALLDPAPLDAPPLEVPEDEGAFALPVLDSAPVEDEDSAFIAFFLDSDG